MLKYTNYEVVFDEVPDEITLAINISNCPNRCPGCHSPELWEDIGKELTEESLLELLDRNKGISCVSFMGGDLTPELINNLAQFVKKSFKNIKVSWYSGKKILSEKIDLEFFDYIKLGPYISKFGGLDKKSTNQRFYRVDNNSLLDITNLFWK